MGSLPALAQKGPFEKAMKIMELRLGCQLEREAFEAELEKIKLDIVNLETINNILHETSKCVDKLQTNISKGGSVLYLVDSLISQKLICENELSNLDSQLLDSSDQAREKLSECTSKVKIILKHKKRIL